MGYLKKIGRHYRNERVKTRAYNLSKQLSEWYATHPVAPWQTQRAQDIRDLYEKRVKDLELAHDHAASRTSEEYMQLELDYLMASHEFRNKNPQSSEMPWSPGASMGIMAKAFLKNLLVKAKSLGLNWNGEKANTK